MCRLDASRGQRGSGPDGDGARVCEFFGHASKLAGLVPSEVCAACGYWRSDTGGLKDTGVLKGAGGCLSAPLGRSATWAAVERRVPGRWQTSRPPPQRASRERQFRLESVSLGRVKCGGSTTGWYAAVRRLLQRSVQALDWLLRALCPLRSPRRRADATLYPAAGGDRVWGRTVVVRRSRRGGVVRPGGGGRRRWARPPGAASARAEIREHRRLRPVV